MILGIGGGTGSGKTTLAQKIIASVGRENAVVLQQDSYYRDLHDMPLLSRHEVNFDHPDAFDLELLFNHLKSLRSGSSIEQPVYDYGNHARKRETLRVDPRPVIIVEGILVLCDAQLRSLMDLKIFIDCDPDIRFIRRLQRDTRERGRSVESVIAQYMNTVRPMHQRFVQPCIRHADVIFSEGGVDEAGVNLILEKIRPGLAFSPSNQ